MFIRREVDLCCAFSVVFMQLSSWSGWWGLVLDSPLASIFSRPPLFSCSPPSLCYRSYQALERELKDDSLSVCREVGLCFMRPFLPLCSLLPLVLSNNVPHIVLPHVLNSALLNIFYCPHRQLGLWGPSFRPIV